MPVKRIADLRSESVDDLIERLVTKHSMSMAVYYDWWPVMAQVSNPGELPRIETMIQVGLMIKSKIIGQFIHGTVALDMVPQEMFAERGIEGALNDMRTQWVQSGSLFNGGNPAGPTQSLKDKPQH